MYNKKYCIRTTSSLWIAMPISNITSMNTFTLEIMFKNVRSAGGPFFNLSSALNAVSWTMPPGTLRTDRKIQWWVYNNAQLVLNQVLDINKWYVFTVTRNGNVYNCYIDNVLVGTCNYAFSGFTGTGYWHTRGIGSEAWPASADRVLFDGYFQYLKIYNQVLTETERKYSYRKMFEKSNNTALFNKLTTYVVFQEGSGQTKDVVNGNVSGNIGQWVTSDADLLHHKVLVLDDRGNIKQPVPPPRKKYTSKTCNIMQSFERRIA